LTGRTSSPTIVGVLTFRLQRRQMMRLMLFLLPISIIVATCATRLVVYMNNRVR